MPDPDERNEKSYTAVFLDGVKNCISNISKNTKHIIFISSTAVYPDSDKTFNELSPITTSTFRAKALLTAEQIIKESTIPYTIIRATGIYGENREKNISPDFIKNNQSLYINRIAEIDLARAIIHLLKTKPMKTLIATDSTPIKANEYLQHFKIKIR